MRLPEAKIKQALLHPDKMVRHEALRYFTRCFSRDEEVMPLVIQAIEKYGRQNAFRELYNLANLAQTEATIDWAIRELHREELEAEDRESYFSDLSRLLCSADARLLSPRKEEILKAPGFPGDLAPNLEDQLRLATWDAEQCWKELERISAEGVKKYYQDMDFSHVARVVQTLAPRAERYAERILELLGKKIEDPETDPMGWMEIFLLMLAGEMRLERAIPLLVERLGGEGDIDSEESINALGKIGTDAAAEAVADAWQEAEWDYRISATEALSKIHSDTTVQKCLELLPQTKEYDVRTFLAGALLDQMAEEGIEPIRQMVEKRTYDVQISDLMGHLVAVSTILEATYPEYPVWKRQAEERWARDEKMMRKMRASLESPLPFTPPPPPPPAGESDVFPERKPAPFLNLDKPVGRNDPCPCGSGKKFKKCCMNKTKS